MTPYEQLLKLGHSQAISRIALRGDLFINVAAEHIARHHPYFQYPERGFIDFSRLKLHFHKMEVVCK